MRRRVEDKRAALVLGGQQLHPTSPAPQLWVAREFAAAPPPPPWGEHEDDDGNPYYHDPAAGVSQAR